MIGKWRSEASNSGGEDGPEERVETLIGGSG